MTPDTLAAIRARHAEDEDDEERGIFAEAHADRGALLDHIASVQVGIDALETKIAALEATIAALQAFRARVEGRT